jgi:hypothetical protein
VTGTLEELRALAKDLDDAYLRVTLKTVVPMPGLAEQVKELLPNALDVSVDHPRDAREIESERQDPRTRLDPGELFETYYERKNGVPPSPELRKLFHALYEEAQH